MPKYMHSKYRYQATGNFYGRLWLGSPRIDYNYTGLVFTLDFVGDTEMGTDNTNVDSIQTDLEGAFEPSVKY